MAVLALFVVMGCNSPLSPESPADSSEEVREDDGGTTGGSDDSGDSGSANQDGVEEPEAVAQGDEDESELVERERDRDRGNGHADAVDSGADQQLEATTLFSGANSPLTRSGSYVARDKATLAAIASRFDQVDSAGRLLDDELVDGGVVIAYVRQRQGTGGYSVSLEHAVSDDDGGLVATFRGRDPEPGTIVTMAFTRPYEIVHIEGDFESVTVEYVNPDEGNWLHPF